MNKFLKLIVVSQIILILPLFVFAAPSISSTNGSFAHGQSATVSGSGFGTKSPVDPWLYDQVDNISAYSAVSDGSCVPVGTGYVWEKNGGDAHSGTCGYEINRTHIMRHPHVTANYYSYCPSANIPNQLGNNSKRVNGNNMYLSWWYRLGSALNETVSTKCLRLTDGQNWDVAVNTAWANAGHEVYDNETATMWSMNGGWNPAASVWHRNEYWSTPTLIRAWIDGSQNFSTNMGGNIADPPLTLITHIGLDPGQGVGCRPIDFGEIYVDDTSARVEICSGSTWASKGNCEIQIPQTTWNDGQLQIKVNQGSFTDSSSQYLYVIDASGDANTNGYPVTFGGGSSDTTPPSAPQGLAVL